MSAAQDKPQRQRNPLPISAPERRPDERPATGEPDLRLEEIEDKHIPKDRNIFDK